MYLNQLLLNSMAPCDVARKCTDYLEDYNVSILKSILALRLKWLLCVVVRTWVVVRRNVSSSWFWLCHNIVDKLSQLNSGRMWLTYAAYLSLFAARLSLFAE